MTAGSATEEREPPFLVLMYALWGGLSSWAVHLWTLTSLVSPACEHGVTWVLHVVTAVTAIGAVTAIAAGVWMARRVSTTAAANGRTRMLSALAVLIDVISLALIVVEGGPVFVLSPCKLA